MANNKKKEELLSRRDFFKNAAKGVLPIVGAIVLGGLPHVVNAEETPMGCQYSCSVGCGSGCSGCCDGTCTDACARGCRNYCNAGCDTTCRRTCQGYCARTCTSLSRY